MTGSRFIVVGGAGFIGSHFADRLLADAAVARVTIYDNFSSGREWHLSGHLADECADIIGESHQTTLETRYAAAHWTAATGDHTGAARRYQALLADLAGVLGDDHWLAQECRIELAELKEHPGPPHGDEPAPGARPKS